RKIALVSGAAGAIGFATARLLLERGAHVVLSDLPGEALDRAVEELARIHTADRVLGVAMDVSDENQVERAFHDCVLAFGGLDILVANAGIAHTGSLDALALEDWERVLRVNETGTFLCLREAARLMKWQRLGGRLILNASKNVPPPGADFAAYSASKAGAVQVARVAALELAEHGITVNLVHADGVFADEESGRSSGLWDSVGPERMASRGQSPEELRSHYQERNLLQVPVSARHVAEAIAFFAEGRTPTTGAALTVDGGHKETFYR
ncbi:MAG: SDR family oxidoreductase, partial [Planctomycetota bacterium]